MRALRPLRHRDFRLLGGALCSSLVADGIWLVAVAWQVVALGGGPVDLSLVTGLFAVGLVACMLPAGVLADRVPRRRLLLGADLVRGVATAVLGVLAVGGGLELWHLAVGGLLIGSAEACFVPAFSALVPQLVPGEELLAANGLEGVIRPLAVQAAGPALGGVLVAVSSPGTAMFAGGALYVASVACLLGMRTAPLPGRDAAARTPASSGLRSALAELVEGARYVRAHRWLWGTLLFAVVAVLALAGPVRVLLPFAVRDGTGGGSAEYGLVLAVYGIASAVGALLVSSRPVPRHYLTALLLMWGLGAAPLVLVGSVEVLWLLAAIFLVVGLVESGGQVVWGTLLQRRVPPRLQGRVASLDWFVSLALLPVSMALAGPAGELLGVGTVFAGAAVLSGAAAVAVLWGLGLRRDEVAHPLED